MKKQKSPICKVVYVFCIIDFLVIMWGKLFVSVGDEMAYGILGIYLILPITAFAEAIVIGGENKIVKWIVPIIFGVLALLPGEIVFHATGLSYFISTFIGGVFGLLIGMIIAHFAKRRNAKNRC